MGPSLNCSQDNDMFGIHPCYRYKNLTTNSTSLSEESYLLDLWSILICVLILLSCFMALYGRGLVRCIKTKKHKLNGYHDVL